MCYRSVSFQLLTNAMSTIFCQKCYDAKAYFKTDTYPFNGYWIESNPIPAVRSFKPGFFRLYKKATEEAWGYKL